VEQSPYSDLVTQLKAINPRDADFGRRLNELININELLTTLNTARSLEETLDIMILTILGQYGCRRGAIFIKSDRSWRCGIDKGIKRLSLDLHGLPLDESWNDLPNRIKKSDDRPAALDVFFQDNLVERIFPAKNDGKLVGLICLGRSLLGERSNEKESLLMTIADLGGVIIGNSLYRRDLELVNRQLQRQIFQLNTLYEITGSFARCYENEDVYQILTKNLMGQFFISRCAVLATDQRGFRIAFHKGLKAGGDSRDAPGILPWEHWPGCVADIDAVPCPHICDFMRANRLHYALPIVSEGQVVGLLLLGERLDRKKLAEADKDFINSLAQQAAVAVENVRLQKEALEKQRMEKELQLAREIQQKLLPKGVPILDGYEIAVEMRPYYQVGGDFYDFIMAESGLLTMCLADVSGKSLPASMIMSTAQASLRALNSFAGLSPKDIVEKLNLYLCHSTQSNKFVTMFYAVLDPRAHILSYINAGHNRPILIRPDKTIDLLSLGGMVVGLFPSATYQVGAIPFEPGTELLIYTDGLSEVTDRSGEEYGDERLVSILLERHGSGTVEEEKNQIVEEVMRFSSNEMVDDLTLLLLRRKKL